jgi:hypothetical protein
MNTTFGSISSGHILNGWGAITFGTPMTKKQHIGKTPINKSQSLRQLNIYFQHD